MHLTSTFCSQELAKCMVNITAYCQSNTAVELCLRTISLTNIRNKIGSLWESWITPGFTNIV